MDVIYGADTTCTIGHRIQVCISHWSASLPDNNLANHTIYYHHNKIKHEIKYSACTVKNLTTKKIDNWYSSKRIMMFSIYMYVPWTFPALPEASESITDCPLPGGDGVAMVTSHIAPHCRKHSVKYNRD